MYLGSKVPYGYNRGDEPNHLPVINPETAPIVKRIFDMRVQGMSPLKICAVLNEEGIPSPAEYYYQQRERMIRRTISICGAGQRSTTFFTIPCISDIWCS